MCSSDLNLRAGARPATVLLNVSNLAWYGESVAIPQHLQISRMRTLETGRPMLRVVLKYAHGGHPVIRELKRVSSPGLRKYVAVNEIPRVRNGLGVAILSTSKGLMTDREARQHRTGGELLAVVW